MSEESEISDKTVVYEGIKYLINNEEKTAGIVGCNYFDKMIIPRSFLHNSEEYIITSILKGAFFDLEMHELEFVNDSEIRTIHESAFSLSSIKYLTLPPKLVELKKGWCSDAEKILFINISSKNPYFKIYENNFLLKKSSTEQNDYDQLVFLCPKRRDCQNSYFY